MRGALTIAALAAVLVSAGCLGGVGADAEISAFQPRVSVGPSEPPSTGSDGVRTCVAVGPPPGSYGVAGSVRVERPVTGEASRSVRFRVDVRVGEQPWRTARNVSLFPGDGERVQLLAIGGDEGSLSAGESVTAAVRVRRSGATVAEASETVRVEEAPGCVETPG